MLRPTDNFFKIFQIKMSNSDSDFEGTIVIPIKMNQPETRYEINIDNQVIFSSNLPVFPSIFCLC